ncbi:unnamed protein product [Ambrosiozyma monospora]|uniref:Unnamed protein product n=1 Tax=Ambrosiozyma monospora TaxID=43982 RepID=A0A9W7DH98_AMBMO|nr:unnamed protein product [Ambrosiozyma monospora]
MESTLNDINHPASEIGLMPYYIPSDDDTKIPNDESHDAKQKQQTIGIQSINTNELTIKKPSRLRRFANSFKRVEIPDLDSTLTEMERSYILASHPQLQRNLHGRHLQMISIGGSIGSGLFVGSGSALRVGGPASVLIAWTSCSLMMYCNIQALTEMTVTYPVSGAFVQYSSRFISPAWGFAMAWNYAFGWSISLPLEMVAASITIKYWNDNINPAAWVSIFYVLIIVINLFGVRGYGEAEFVLSSIKIIAIVGFIILGIILNCGGGPSGEGYIGGKYWHNPGAFHNGFKGLFSVFPTAAFSFGGTELIGLTAAETRNPRKALPQASKQVFWRISLFYIISMLLVALLVPYNDKRLFSSSSVDTSASPFVIAIENGRHKSSTIFDELCHHALCDLCG